MVYLKFIPTNRSLASSQRNPHEGLQERDDFLYLRLRDPIQVVQIQFLHQVEEMTNYGGGIAPSPIM
jgi:hypothetical protein